MRIIYDSKKTQTSRIHLGKGVIFMQKNSSFLDCHPSLLLNVGVFRMGGEKMNYWGKPRFPLVDCGIFKA